LKRVEHRLEAAAERDVDAEFIGKCFDRRQPLRRSLDDQRLNAKALRELELFSGDLPVLADLSREIRRHPHIQRRHPLGDSI